MPLSWKFNSDPASRPTRRILAEQSPNVQPVDRKPSTIFPPLKKQIPSVSVVYLSPTDHGLPSPAHPIRQRPKHKLVSDERSTVRPPKKKQRTQLQVLLGGLRCQLEAAIDKFKDYSGIPDSDWYQSLELQLATIASFRGRAHLDIARDPILKESYDPPEDLDHEPQVLQDIRTTFDCIETSRQNALKDLSSCPTSSPISQSNSEMPLGTTHIFLKHPELESMCSSFYLFSLLQEIARHYKPDDHDYFEVRRTTTRFFQHIARNKDDRLGASASILPSILPDDEEYHWCFDEQLTDHDPVRKGLTYQRKADQYPAIIVEVGTELSEKDDLFTRAEALYTLLAPQSLRKSCGAPVFIVVFAGSYMSFGGVFCDSPQGLHTFQYLPGSIDLQNDLYSFQQGVYSLWALKNCFLDLKKLLNRPDAGGIAYWPPKTPRVGLAHRDIQIIEVLKEGIAYRVKLKSGSGFADLVNIQQTHEGTTYVIKVIYRYPNGTYSITVHSLLAKLGFAPMFYTKFYPLVQIDLVQLEESDHLYLLIVMANLPPPTPDDAGWITLADFADNFAVAMCFKVRIRTTLEHIIKILRDHNLVHGDLRPNNILIKVAMKDGIYYPTDKVDMPHLVDICVVDFDWAGNAGEVRYPDSRNPEVKYWPGSDGQIIEAHHDLEMITEWLKFWPGQPPLDS